jgi:hypothetical protein
VLLVLAFGSHPAAAKPAPLAPDDLYQLFIPLIVNTGYTYLPVVLRTVPTNFPINIITNPSFEDTRWTTDLAGNQHPFGWTFYSPAAGQVMPFPMKWDNGVLVPAISDGQGEYVHKFWWQLPEDEWLGGARGLILDGGLTYKIFSDHLAHALVLSQTLTYTPGRWVKVTGYIVGETQPNACGGGPFGADHFMAAVRLGSIDDTRYYGSMIHQFDVPDNTRPWNKFSVTAQVPANGHLDLVVIAQTNWACAVDFFVDHFEAFDTPMP